MKKKLIITAHDFGSYQCINQGIIYALKHRNNIISEISLVPNSYASKEAAQAIKAVPVSVSLETNFTTGRPLATGVNSLTGKDGNFLRVNTETWDFSAIDRFDEQDVVCELDAQWDWFVKNVGKKPTAILSKKNEIGDPKILLPVVEKAKKEKVPIRTPVWKWRENYAAQSYVEQEGVKATNNCFIGLDDWRGKFGYDLENDLDRFINDVNDRPGISELIVFPGFVDKELIDKSTLSWERGRFLAILDKQNVIDKIKNSFDLISYADL